MTFFRAEFAVLATLFATPSSPALSTAQPPAATFTFTRDVAPIIFEHCSGCHRPGESAPFSLLTYEDARRHAKQIVLATETRYMPPWKPEPGYGEFAGARRLSDQQIARIRQWVDEGAVEGDPRDLPAPPRWADGWQLGSPDVVVSMPETYVLKAEGADVFRSFVIPIPASARRYVKGLEFHPGNPRAVHHANIKIDRTEYSRRLDEDDPGPGYEGGAGRSATFPDGHFLGWTPGQLPHASEDAAWRLEPGSDLVVEVHMMPTGKPEPVQISVGLFLTDQAPRRVPYMLRLGKQSIDIPPGEKHYTVTDTYVLPVDVDVLGVQPHAHYLAKEVTGFARLPDGTTRSLIYIKDWDFQWQDVYRYVEPLSLPRGTTLGIQYTYDNSPDNLRNPNHPPKRVTFGQTTASEMGDVWFQVLPRTTSDLAILDRDYAPKMLQEDIAGDEKTLEVNPGDARLRADLASCYVAAGRIADAITQLQAALRLEPDFAPTHYDLGLLLLRERRLNEADQQFSRAVQLKPNFPEAHNNLGVVRFLRGQVDQAIGSYREALRMSAGNADAHYNLARALDSRGNGDEAIREYRQVLEIRPDDAEAHASLGTLLASQGQIEEALPHYRRALQVKPDLPAALVDLAWILATADDPQIRAPDEAIRLAERVAELTRHESPTVLDTLAMAYFSAGRLDRAISTAQAALDLASAAGAGELANRIRLRLEFYKQQSP